MSDRNYKEKLTALVNCATLNFYEYFQNCHTYAEAKVTLERLYVKTLNDIYLLTEKQKSS